MPYSDNKKQQEYQKKYRIKNPDYFSNWTISRRKKIIEFLGGKCNHCGITDLRVLQIDHKRSNGKEDREKYNDNRRLFDKHILIGKLPKEDYQILCANCNWIKRFTHNECKQKK